jgi:acyl-CoA thioester hydrolase
MDALGHVNNVRYLQYLESARIAYFEAKGWNSVAIGPSGHGPVVVSQTFNYRRQLHYPAEVEVGVACTEVRNRSFVLSYGVFRKGTDELVGDGHTVLTWMDYAAGKASEIPEEVRAYLQARR